MNNLGVSALLRIGAAFSLICGVASTALADEASAPDSASAISVMDLSELDGLRGGDINIFEEHVNSHNTTVTTSATNNVEATIGEGTMTIGGDYYGGDVIISDQALGAFNGIFTGAISTAPFGNVTATTSLSILLVN